MSANGKLVVVQEDASRCTGHCCRAFCLNARSTPNGLSPAEIAENYRAWSSCELVDDDARDGNGYGTIDEIWLIAPMVRYLGFFEAGQSHPADPTRKLNGAGHFFACVHLQPDGDCGIYATRPTMCRNYPGDEPCAFIGCTRRAARETEQIPSSRVSCDGQTANETRGAVV